MGSDLAWSLSARLYRSERAARLLFGVRVSPLPPGGHHFDVTTWVMTRRALREVSAGSHVIDLGAGSQAIVGLALWRRTGCRVTAVEPDPTLAAAARRNVERNGAPIEVREGRLLDPVSEAFDLVVFNPPYVPTAVGLRQRLPESHRSQWDGGEDGLDVARGFLDAVRARGHPLRFCLGVNAMHVDLARLEDEIAKRPEIRIQERHRRAPLPPRVYVGDVP